MKTLNAGDLMSSPVATIEAGASLSNAIDQFLEKKVSRFLVMENNTPVGVISPSDFVAAIAHETRFNRETVGDAMSEAVLVCRDTPPVSSAARAITSAKWRSVLVMDARGSLLGIFSGCDLLKRI